MCIYHLQADYGAGAVLYNGFAAAQFLMAGSEDRTANITMETPKNKDFPSLVRAHLQGQDRQLAFCLSKANLLHSWCHLRTFFYHRTGAFCCTHDKLSEKEPGGYERKLPWNYAGLLKRKRKGEAVPGTFILLILLTHTSLHSADVLLKDIQDSSSYSSAYCY